MRRVRFRKFYWWLYWYGGNLGFKGLAHWAAEKGELWHY